jgi:hypothetical protein
MKRAVIILVLGTVLAVLGGAAVYCHETAPVRSMLCCQNPELAWLQHEFKMSDDQLAHVQKLDASYQASCAELCRRIRATNDMVRVEFASQKMTAAQLQPLLASAGQLRGDCQFHMLQYCQAVSREMPPVEGKRYLQWVCDRVLGMPGNGSMPMHDSGESAHGH